ncbi:MAG: FtsL-like putative cell division protein [Flavobacteriaceae bacterium]|nr:FtsL-like putative cell division protein [Flavobacteriaceae bacterium]
MNNFLSFLNIDFLINDDSFKNWRMILFISILALLMISSAHNAEDKIFKIAQLNENIKELKAEFVENRAYLMDLKMESKIYHKLNRINIKPANKPPIRILINDKR